jgi:hypothetical protein
MRRRDTDNNLRKAAQPDEYDSPWKEAIERYFEAFMAFFFPEAHAGIDWSRGYEFLDTELQQVVRDAELGRRLADKLVRVWRRDGEEAWVLVHVEVQGQPDIDFPRRMYVYNYRFFDRFGRVVVSLAVLGDSDPHWRPDRFAYQLWGCEAGVRFPTAKLLDYESRWGELEQSRNPFAVVVMAHLRSQSTRRQPETRLQWKLRIVKGLYERGLDRQDILNLFHVIDWMMLLPKGLATRFGRSLEEYEQEMRMPYITSIERHGIEKGLQQGLQQGRVQALQEVVLETLEDRFRKVPGAVRKAVSATEDPSLLKDLRRCAANAASMDEFRAALAAPGDGNANR